MLLYIAEIPVPLSNEIFHINNRNTGIDTQKTQSTKPIVQKYMNSPTQHPGLIEVVFVLFTILTGIVSTHPYRTMRRYGTRLESFEILSLVSGVCISIVLLGLTWLLLRGALSSDLNAITLVVNLAVSTWPYRHLCVRSKLKRCRYTRSR